MKVIKNKFLKKNYNIEKFTISGTGKIYNLILLVFPIQSFVISNIIKGLTLFNVLVITNLIFDIFIFKKYTYEKVLKPFIVFFFLFVAYQLLEQLGNLIFIPDFQNLTLISSESINKFIFRKSLFTQSLYLFVDILFFFYILYFLRTQKEKIFKLSFFAISLFILYGFIEVIGFLITGHYIDFISNRITGVDYNYGLLQSINIGGIAIQRMKSLAGEPSMFAFTVLPFFILSTYLKKYFFASISLFALLISTSGTAVIGILLFLLIDLLLMRKAFKISFLIISLILLVGIIKYDIILSLYQFFEAKIALSSLSGVQRYGSFISHFNFWLHSDLFHFLFGYGFGYVRSTDGLSTILVNIGLFGFLAYIIFFFYPFIVIQNKSLFMKGLFVTTLVVFIVILISVSEFFYPHIWLFNAFAWNEYLKVKHPK